MFRVEQNKWKVHVISEITGVYVCGIRSHAQNIVIPANSHIKSKQIP